jgi:competence protein ComEC
MSTDSIPTIRFFQQPFLLLTLSLCIGILIGFEFQDWSSIFLGFGLFFFVSFLIFSLIGKVQGNTGIPFYALGFVFIGILLIQSREGLWNNRQLNEVYQKSDLVLVQLRDVGNSDKTWKKMTGNIKRLYKGQSEIALNEPLVLFVKSESFGCESGDVLLVSSELNEIKNANNPGEFDAENFWNKKGFGFMTFVGEEQYKIIQHKEKPWVIDQLDKIRAYLSSSLKENLSDKELAIALALILGDKSLLDQEITTSFTNTGAMHVLAVSGLHIGIIMQILMAILGQFSKVLSRKNAVIFVVVIMWIYAIITGLSPSVLRAVFMFSVLVLSQLMGKNHNSINSLFFTAFCLILIEPYTLYDIGFQLSFLAMLGIFLLYKPIEQIIYIENKWIRKVWQGTAIGFGAQLMTTPLSLYYFHQFPNYFVLTNIGLMASSGLILGLGIWIFTISWWTAIARLSGMLLSFIIFISLWFIEWVEQLPGAVAYGFEVPLLLVLFITCLVLLLFLVLRKPSYVKLAYGIGFLCLCLIVFKRYKNHVTDELCVFNARQMIITVRKGDQLFCFYKAKEDDFDKVEFAVKGYQKIHPGKIHYFSLDDKDWKIKSDKTQLRTITKKDHVVIEVNDKTYTILLSDYSEQSNDDSKLIGMPWVEKKCDHYLNNGAFVASI